jgi:hypothetical protein
MEAGTIVGVQESQIVTTKFYPTGSDTPAPMPEVDFARGPGDGHFGNFLAAMRSRKTADLNAPLEEGHLSSALCHLANISYRLGEPVALQANAKALAGNEAGEEAVQRMKEHLRSSGLQLETMTCQLGRRLNFDAHTERFPDDPEASAMLTRQYRQPFAVPDKA